MAEEVGEYASAEPEAKSAPADVSHDSPRRRLKYTPGSAIVYKGEPSAIELRMLRFGLTNRDLGRLNGVVAAVLDGYKKLEELGEQEKKDYVEKVVERIEEDDLAAPLEIDYSAPDGSYSPIAEKSTSAPKRVSSLVSLLSLLLLFPLLPFLRKLWPLLRKLYLRRIKGDKN